MAVPSQSNRVIGILIALFLGATCLVAAQAIANTASLTGLAIALGVLVLIVCFNWPEAGLYILIFSMLLGPEMIVGGLGEGTTAGRGITLRLDDFLLTIIAFSWFARGAVHKELGLFLSTPLNRPVGLFILAAAVSTALGMLFDRVRPVVGFFFVLKFVEYVFVYFAAVNFIENKEHLKRLIYAIFITGIFVSIYAAAQIPRGIRVSAPFEGETGEPNTLGGYLLILIALFGGLMITSPNLRTALRYALGIIVMGIPFLYTLSRASYIGLFAAALCLVLFTRRKLIAAFSVTIFLFGLILLAPSAVEERIQYTIGGQAARAGQVEIGGVRLDTSTSARIVSYQQILADFPKQPILGYGVTGYGFIDGQYPKVLIEMGLIGLAAFLWLLLALYRQGRDALKVADGWWERGICIGFLAGLVGLVFHALGSNTFIIVRIMEPFWFMAGVMTLIHMFNTSLPEESRELESPPAQVSYGLISPTPR